MELYPLGSIKDVDVPYDQYITVFAQILFGLSHLHKNGVAHRDLKSENFLFKKKPLTVAITDFGLSKVKDDNTLPKTFCGNLQNLAPEAFPGFSDSNGYGTEVDIWSVGVLMFEWMYNIPNPPPIPEPKRKGQQVTRKQWRDWVAVWVELLLEKLSDEEADDTVVKILLRMIEPNPKKRWSADQCLEYGLQSGLFRMATDGRIVGVDDPDEKDDEDDEDDGDDDGTKTPTARSPTASSSAARPFQRTQARMNVEKTILQGSLWGGGGSTIQRSKRRDLDRSVNGTDIFG
jgi:serine/threonine protein kinase